MWLNVLDLQRLAAIRALDRQISEDHAKGYSVDEALDRRIKLAELVRTGPHA